MAGELDLRPRRRWCRSLFSATTVLSPSKKTRTWPSAENALPPMKVKAWLPSVPTALASIWLQVDLVDALLRSR